MLSEWNKNNETYHGSENESSPRSNPFSEPVLVSVRASEKFPTVTTGLVHEERLHPPPPLHPVHAQPPLHCRHHPVRASIDVAAAEPPVNSPVHPTLHSNGGDGRWNTGGGRRRQPQPAGLPPSSRESTMHVDATRYA
jgi:hypothetical protein